MISRIYLALFGILFLLFISSCSDEKLITEIIPDKNILIATFDGSNAKLVRITFPNGDVINNDVFFAANGKNLANTQVTQISNYLQYIYLIVPNEYKLLILDRTTFKLLVEYSFSEEQLKPRKIVFANATEAYLIFENSDTMYLIDTYYNKVARKIKLEGIPSDILAVGNQVYVTLPLQNKLVNFDTRTHNIEQTLTIENVPYLVQKNANGSQILVLCAGTGKITGDFRETISNPSVAIIDYLTNSIISTNQIKPPKADLLKEYPISFVITNNDWGFFITNNYLIRIDAKQPQNSLLIEQAKYSNIFHNNIYNEFFLLTSTDSQSNIHLADPILGKKKQKLTFNSLITSFSLL